MYLAGKMCLMCRLLVVYYLIITAFGFDACSEFTNPPTFSQPEWKAKEFMVDIEMFSMETENRVIQNTLIYSANENIIRLKTLDAGKSSDLFFFFNDRQVLGFDYSVGRGRCSVRNMSDSAEMYVIGGAQQGIPSPLAMLHFTGASGFGSSNIKMMSLGLGTARGIKCQVFTSCQKWTSHGQSLVLNVTHYFIPDSEWELPYDQQIPIMITVQGSGNLKGQEVQIQHMYSFFNYKTTFDPQLLETPPGIYCPGRTDAKFPPVTNFIHFNSEMLSVMGVQYLEEIFDVDHNFALFRTQAGYSRKYGMSQISILRDYATGLSFEIFRGCTVKNITDSTFDLPSDSIDAHGKVREATADQFFYSGKNKYQYLGKRRVRGLSCETYISNTSSVSTGTNIILEWYFAPHNVSTWNDAASEYRDRQLQLPIKSRAWYDESMASIDVNMYHIDYSQKTYGAKDVELRRCFQETASNFFRVLLEGEHLAILGTALDVFKWQVRSTLAKAAGVTWWRISDLQVYVQKSDVIIDFEILDSPPFASDVATPTYHPSLQEASENLRSALNKGLDFQLFYGSHKSQTVTFQKDFVNIHASENDKEFDKGTLSGLGVALLAVGVIAGSVGTTYYFKMNGGVK